LKEYEAVIGLEVHAELATQSKMFCGCAVVDPTQSKPNIAVCPICAGMPGMLPVVNRQAVEFGIRVALALECQVAHTSLFARKNYFYPDLPKGYQISQYEYPLAEYGKLVIDTGQGPRTIRIRRVHLEEDTGKLTHVERGQESFSLVDLNRAGVPLLEIVSEPDMHTVEEVRAYTSGLRNLLRFLEVNSGDMEKGAIRFEANVSVRPQGVSELGTRVEIKNLNSFRALERATTFEIERQVALLESGGRVEQETLGWNEASESTFSQRSKEEAHDYRYFPEPDLPPLEVDQAWIDRVAAGLPELPRAKKERFQSQYGLTAAEAALLAEDRAVANYFEQAAKSSPQTPPRVIVNWIQGELFGWIRQSGQRFADLRVSAQMLSGLLEMVQRDEINPGTAKSVLAEMLVTGKNAAAIASERGLQQVSDASLIAAYVRQVLAENPGELTSYLSGKETLSNWFFGQVMRRAAGQGNPQVIRAELERQLTLEKQRLG
jgi:aspartyl-tRNA(Asn)/glutamyl-tRNA(Gln) amidotransferase subunit B